MAANNNVLGIGRSYSIDMCVIWIVKCIDMYGLYRIVDSLSLQIM